MLLFLVLLILLYDWNRMLLDLYNLQMQGEGIAHLGGSWSQLASPLNPFARDVQHNGPRK